MPISIKDNNAQITDLYGNAMPVNKNMCVPKFFNKSILTGNGGSGKGLLTANSNPCMHKNGYSMKIDPNLQPGTHYNKDIKIYDIPCYIISPDMWGKIKEFDRPDKIEMQKIAVRENEEIYLTMPIHALQVEETRDNNNKINRKLSASLFLFLFAVNDPSTNKHIRAADMNDLMSGSKNLYHSEICYNIFNSLRTVESSLAKNGYTVDRTAMNYFVDNYSLYSELCKAAERWIYHTDYYIADVLVPNIHTATINQPNNLWTAKRNSVFNTLSRMEKYDVPLEMYQTIYNKLQNIIPPDTLTNICKANLNLKLSNTLHHMNMSKASLPSCPCTNHVNAKIPYSKEQLDALETTSPLTIVQSGAGTGKSTVILGRIDHMLANGINQDDITVLSFTNAAATHIEDMKPGIHSMTIASMLHTIYAANFPTHELSKIATIINSLKIYYDGKSRKLTEAQEEFISDFCYVLERLQDNNEFTRANNFVEKHIDSVISALDTIEQTSLELESIICYQKMDTLIEPPETRTKHLIIDEVQDNSIAEFIYSIKYTEKHHCSLYIVGDCSQTLYEFRSSNPKALNVLENSGVFTTYKLQTNYRSNQEILDFANIQLGNIEANRYAKIQLYANSLKPVTLQSFKDAVKLKYIRMINKSQTAYDNLFSHAIAVDTRDYIQDKLAKKEQVCILAPARKTLAAIKQNLQQMYPGTKIASLIPVRQYDNDLFSKFIARYWNNIAYMPPANIIQIIRKEIINNIQCLTAKSANMQVVTDIANKMIEDFETQHGKTIEKLQNQVIMSVITQKDMLDSVKKLMLQFEIQKNSIAQSITSAKNAERKQSNDIKTAEFIISTIHSAKGLEFDNVIIFYASESESTIDEATKRMYYVALTRAKKTEFIFAYDKLANPKIQEDYDKIIKDLSKNAPVSQIPCNTATPDVSNVTDVIEKPDIPDALITPDMPTEAKNDPCTPDSSTAAPGTGIKPDMFTPMSSAIYWVPKKQTRLAK